jgi:beta-glucosidase
VVPLPLSALAYWDVAAGRMIVDPGEYLIRTGPSSAAAPQVARITVRGPQPPPRTVTGGWAAAASFDGSGGIVLLDETRERGDVAAPVGPSPGWLVFRDVAAWAGAATLTLRAAREQPGAAQVSLYAAPPGPPTPPTLTPPEPLTPPGVLLGTVSVPSTRGRYRYATVAGPLRPLPAGASLVTDLYLVLDGPVRLAGFTVQPAPGQPAPGQPAPGQPAPGQPAPGQRGAASRARRDSPGAGPSHG